MGCMALATHREPTTRASTHTEPTHAVPTSAALIRAIETIASFVGSFEPGRYCGDDAAQLLSSFTRGERLCAAGKTLAAKRAAESNQHQRHGHRSAAHWLADLTGESVGDAIEVLSLGDSLQAHPGVDSAYREGRLSRSKAKAISGAVGVNPGSEDELVAAAEAETLRQLRDRCLRAKAQGRSKRDAKAAYEALHRSRSCRTWTDPTDGAFRLDARLTPDAGASLLASLRAESTRVFDQARKDGLVESSDAYAADALVALVTGRGNDSGHSGGGTDTEDPGSNRQAKRPGLRASVHVRVDLDALRTGVIGDGQICEIPGVGPIPVETATELMGDALCHLVITNGIDVTTICHLGRAIPAALKIALMERDPTCVVPGCDVATGLEIDHRIVPFCQDGPASMWNLARLCGHHHYLRTHKGFELTGGPGTWQWVPPGADPVKPQPPPDRPGHFPKQE